MNSFFKETAEELVNRLIIKNLFPLLTSELKSRLIFHLKNFDDDNQKSIADHPNAVIKADDPDFSELEKKLLDNYWEEFFKNVREQLVLSAYNMLAPAYTKKLPPHKPTHRHEPQKLNHLRLVVNNG